MWKTLVNCALRRGFRHAAKNSCISEGRLWNRSGLTRLEEPFYTSISNTSRGSVAVFNNTHSILNMETGWKYSTHRTLVALPGILAWASRARTAGREERSFLWLRWRRNWLLAMLTVSWHLERVWNILINWLIDKVRLINCIELMIFQVVLWSFGIGKIFAKLLATGNPLELVIR